jgi:ribonuclease P protein component
MLPKCNRIVTEKEIKLVYSSKCRHRFNYWNIIIRKNKFQKIYKVLIVISKKIAKKANLRNLLKRRIMDIVQNIDINNNYSVIIHIQSSLIIKLKFTNLKTALENDILPIIK